MGPVEVSAWNVSPVLVSRVTRVLRRTGSSNAVGVAAQVVRDLVLGRVRAGGGGERHAGQGVVLGGGEQPQRVPAAAPHVPDLRSGVEEQERGDALLAQVPADGEAGLSGADDEHVDVLGSLGLGGRSVLRLVLGLHRDS